jgi:hypothetical protein
MRSWRRIVPKEQGGEKGRRCWLHGGKNKDHSVGKRVAEGVGGGRLRVNGV